MKRSAIYAIVVVIIALVAAVAVAVVYVPTTQEKIIYWTQIAPAQQRAALIDNIVQGAVSWEPYVSDSLIDDTAEVIAWSNEIWPHHPCCVVAVKKSFAESQDVVNNDLVARVVRAHIDATNWISETIQNGGENYTKLLQIGAQFSGRSNEVVESAIEHIEFNYEITPAIKKWFENYTSMFADLGQISSLGGYSNVSAFVDSIVNTTYLERAMSVTPSDTILGTVRLGYLMGDLHQFARVVAMNESLWGGKTLFEKYGVDIQSPPPYANGAYLMDGFARDEIDMGYLGSPPALLKRINANIQIEIVSMVNSGGSAIIAKSGFASFSELEGQTFATPGVGSIQHLLLMYYANENGYKLKLKGT